ncbi:MAG TPA: L,D-transpeptidase family protein [Vicinamibacterales bacterium]|nr:L,D-transpeptidase family protein [Vicinamibacterales bacterium]
MIRSRVLTASAAIALALGVTSCGAPVSRDQIAGALARALDATPKTARVKALWPSVRTFYETREHRLAWRDDDRVDAARAAIDASATHGLAPADYDAAGIARAWDAIQKSESIGDALGAELAAFDIRVTTALMALGHDVAVGRTSPSAISSSWKARRPPPDLAASLSDAVQRDRLVDWTDALAPRHPEYAALRRLLDELRRVDSPDDARMEQVAVNLERWRWMPDDLGDRHLLVNIPAFTLQAREQGETRFEMRVVVGKRGNETPVFSRDMETVVFRPYWNIPESIATAETARLAADDPDYLARNGIEVLRVSGSGPRRVDPDEIDWEAADQVKGVLLRQRPGAGNALGNVKFMLPNRHNVYLHDTPSTSFFKREMRALSHGCVRLAEPATLAEYVLRDRPEWTPERIRAAMAGRTEAQVPLRERLPVHIVYFTVVVGADGQPVFLSDVYKYDARQRRGRGTPGTVAGTE